MFRPFFLAGVGPAHDSYSLSTVVYVRLLSPISGVRFLFGWAGLNICSNVFTAY